MKRNETDKRLCDSKSQKPDQSSDNSVNDRKCSETIRSQCSRNVNLQRKANNQRENAPKEGQNRLPTESVRYRRALWLRIALSSDELRAQLGSQNGGAPGLQVGLFPWLLGRREAS